MSNRSCALVWTAAAAVAAILGFIVLQSNLVFALCFAAIAVALLAIAGSCLLRAPPPVVVEEVDDRDLSDPEGRPRRKWHPR